MDLDEDGYEENGSGSKEKENIDVVEEDDDDDSVTDVQEGIDELSDSGGDSIDVEVDDSNSDEHSGHE